MNRCLRVKLKKIRQNWVIIAILKENILKCTKKWEICLNVLNQKKHSRGALENNPLKKSQNNQGNNLDIFFGRAAVTC